MDYAHWLQDFEAEAERRRQREDPPWARGARLHPEVARSVQRFQVGEAGDGANLIAKAAGDGGYLATVKVAADHGRALRELGVGRLVFVADVLTAFETALARIRGEEPKPAPRHVPRRARPRGLV